MSPSVCLAVEWRGETQILTAARLLIPRSLLMPRARLQVCSCLLDSLDRLIISSIDISQCFAVRLLFRLHFLDLVLSLSPLLLLACAAGQALSLASLRCCYWRRDARVAAAAAAGVAGLHECSQTAHERLTANGGAHQIRVQASPTGTCHCFSRSTLAQSSLDMMSDRMAKAPKTCHALAIHVHRKGLWIR